MNSRMTRLHVCLWHFDCWHSETIENIMRHFSITADIDAPPSRVYQVMTDIDRWYEWSPSINTVKRIDGAPLALGSRALIHQPKFPPATWKITEIVPGKSFTWVSTAPGMRVIARHAVEAVPRGSRATLS